MRHITASDFRYPALWNGCVYAHSAGLGVTGTLAVDSSIRKNNGTITNADMTTVWSVSENRYSLLFDATNDHILLPSSAVLLTSGSPYSVSWWERVTSNTNTFPSRFCLDVAGSSSYWICFRSTNATYSSITWGVSPAAGSDSNKSSTSPSLASSVGIWRHWCITGSDPISTNIATQSLRVDSVSYTVENMAGTLGTVATNRIGHDGTDSGSDCRLDDIRIYNCILTEGQIRLLSTRRGIAYETIHRRSYKTAAVAGNRRRRLLIGS